MAVQSQALLLAASLAAGCVFRGQAVSDAAPGVDFADVDLAGVDFTNADLAGVDLAAADLSTWSSTGPGPLGSLAPGFCCTKDEQCSGRRCGGGYCTQFCGIDAECQRFTNQLRCDTNANLCVPVAPPFTCLDPSTYHYGAMATGTCCSGSAQSNDQCQGGWCLSTGLSSNPWYCSQGCDVATPCPIGYTCFSQANGFISDLRNCWKDPTATDQTATITCQ